jgi:hypothetical protein
MESQTFSSFEKIFLQGPVPFTAAVVALSSIAVMPPSQQYALTYAKPQYSIAGRELSSGGFMSIAKKNETTLSSADSNLIPFGIQELCGAESFAIPLSQGLRYIKNMGFLQVDTQTDKEIDAYFSKRIPKEKKLFTNPYKKKT